MINWEGMASQRGTDNWDWRLQSQLSVPLCDAIPSPIIQGFHNADFIVAGSTAGCRFDMPIVVATSCGVTSDNLAWWKLSVLVDGGAGRWNHSSWKTGVGYTSESIPWQLMCWRCMSLHTSWAGASTSHFPPKLLMIRGCVKSSHAITGLLRIIVWTCPPGRSGILRRPAAYRSHERHGAWNHRLFAQQLVQANDRIDISGILWLYVVSITKGQ